MIYQFKRNVSIMIHLCILIYISPLHLYSEESRAERWLDAVSKCNRQDALRLASEIISREKQSSPMIPEYAEVAKKEKISADFFTAPFGAYDFKLWYDALFLKNKLKEFGITPSTKGQQAIKIIFENVTRRIKPLEKQHAVLPWPTGIWVRQFGVCDRQSWILAELVYQAGYDTQVVYLINPETGVSPHTICEILLKQNGKIIHCVADPYSKILLKELSVKELSENKKLMKKIWPDKTNWQKALPHSLFWTPSYPQDYCAKNQILYKFLKEKLGDRCPRFGEDPKKRLLKYQDLSKNNKKFKMGLWYYPFRLLKCEMDIKKQH